MRLLIAVVFVGLVGLGPVACSDEGEQIAATDEPTPSVDSFVTKDATTPTPDTVFSGGDPHPELANTLPNLLKNTGTVILGTVISEDGQREELWPTVAGLPTTPPSPVTLFTVRVDRVIVSDSLHVGQEIRLGQLGGQLPDGRLYVDSITGRLLEPGPTQYLMFLFNFPQDGKTEFGGVAVGRFEVRDGLVIPNGYADGAALAITGLSFDEVRLAKQDPNPKDALSALAKVTIDAAASTISASAELVDSETVVTN